MKHIHRILTKGCKYNVYIEDLEVRYDISTASTERNDA